MGLPGMSPTISPPEPLIPTVHPIPMSHRDWMGLPGMSPTISPPEPLIPTVHPILMSHRDWMGLPYLKQCFSVPGLQSPTTEHIMLEWRMLIAIIILMLMIVTLQVSHRVLCSNRGGCYHHLGPTMSNRTDCLYVSRLYSLQVHMTAQ